MPLYEYQCESCGIVFERLQHFKDEPLKECPECGGAVRRVIQPVGIIFRGSGFYITDSRQLSSSSVPPRKELGAPHESAEEKKALPAAESSKPEKAEATE